MTFLLQKFNATNRTRAEARARNGLRSPARGIAFTSRLAVCLLLAGFLGVGSAMAQVPNVLRVGGGSLTVDAIAGSMQVHHYQIGTETAVQDPTTGATTNTFLVGGIALVTRADNGELTVTPIGAGTFKIAMANNATDPLTNEDDDNDGNEGTPVHFEVQSATAPMVTGAGAGTAYNAGVAASGAIEMLDLIPRDDSSEEYTVTPWFTDPNDVFLDYTASADKVAIVKEADDDDPAVEASTETTPRPVVATGGEAIVTATVIGSKLTIALTAKAKMFDQTDVWVFAEDGNGEYARKQIKVTVGTATNPYIVKDGELEDVILREDDLANTVVDLAAGFEDDVHADPQASFLVYEVSVSDASAAKVESGNVTTFVTSYMQAMVTTGDGTASVSIRPRAAGTVNFTVKATDRGAQCAAGTDENGDAINYVAAISDDSGAGYSDNVTEANPATICWVIGTGGTDPANPAVTVPLYRSAKSVSDVFTVTIVSRSTPKADADIPAQTVIADSVAITFDLEDLNGDKDGEPKAFEDPTKAGLTYTLTPKDAIAGVTVEGSMVTITPIWRIGDKSTTVTVVATNTLAEDSPSIPVTTFDLNVLSASKPVVNHLLAPILAVLPPFGIGVGSSLTFDLQDVTKGLEGIPGADALKGQPLFIDPNATTAKEGETLPGGLLYKMQVVDVDTPHRYDNLSRENHVVSSAGIVTLDPQKAMLTVTGTAPNYMNVTVWAIDRERNMVSATIKFMVTSAVSAENEELPTEVALSQNYPNPFNPQTTIDYALPQAGDVSLVVYDMLGREVDVLLDGPQAAGRHTVRFGANHLPNGAYVYRLVAGDKTITRTMILVK